MDNTGTSPAREFRDAILKALGYLGLMVLGGALAVIILMIFRVENERINAAFSAALSVVVICVYLKRKGWNIKESLFINKIGVPAAVRIAALSAAVTVAVQAIQFVIPEGIAGSPYDALSGNIFLDMLCLVILSPISEELYFRALWIPTLSKGMPKKLAVVVSSLVFAAIHGNPVQIILAFFISVFYSAVFLRTRSAPACILAHCVSNLAAVIFYLFGGGNGIF